MISPVDTLVVAGAPVANPSDYESILARARTIIAVDKGAALCLSLGRVPDMLVGDLDSIDAETLATLETHHVPVHRLPAEKDLSDLDAALDLCAQRLLTAPVVTAASGGRADHALVVAGSLAHHAELSPRLLEPGLEGWILTPTGTCRLELSDVGTTASVIALLGPATVSIRGMRYPLERRTLPALGSLGLSNVVEGGGAQVEIHEGIVLVTVVQDT